jgi:hypothetical protein
MPTDIFPKSGDDGDQGVVTDRPRLVPNETELANLAGDGQRGSRGTFAPVSFDFRVRLTDIQGGVRQMRENGREESWMVFLADTPKASDQTEDRALAIQYSIIDSKLGFDWVLLGPRNVADVEDIAHFAQSKGYQVTRQTMNGVEFLRVEEGDLAALGETILADYYSVPESQELGLIIDGIWLSGGKRNFL